MVAQQTHRSIDLVPALHILSISSHTLSTGPPSPLSHLVVMGMGSTGTCVVAASCPGVHATPALRPWEHHPSPLPPPNPPQPNETTPGLKKAYGVITICVAGGFMHLVCFSFFLIFLVIVSLSFSIVSLTMVDRRHTV